jgi:hydrogenase expression/formation protein HypC
MQIKESGFGYAVCEGLGVTRQVDTLLIGDQPVGTWVLVFLESAREILSEDDAMKISNAVKAVDMVMSNNGELSADGMDAQSIEALFADLTDREISKPASLIAFEQSQLKNNGD